MGGDGSVLQVSNLDEDARLFHGVAMNLHDDARGMCAYPLGARYKLPMPLLWDHNPKLQIGEVIEATIDIFRIDITARVFAPQGPGELKERADAAWQKIITGEVTGLSVYLQYYPDNYKEAGVVGDRLLVLGWDWTELSVVEIPADPRARIKTVSAFAKAAPGSVR